MSPRSGRVGRVPAAVRATIALVVLLVLLAGIPLVLLGVLGVLHVSGVPRLDTEALSWHTLTERDAGTAATGTLLVAGALVVATLCWLMFAVATVAELAAAIRGLPAPHLPAGLSAMQGLAGPLVAAVVLVFLSSGRPTAAAPLTGQPVLTASTVNVIAAVTAARRSHPVQASTVVEPAQHPLTSAQAPDHRTGSGRSSAMGTTCTVVRGDTLWRLAELHLGDGQRWTEIWALNRGQAQHDGGTLTDANVLRPGWVLLLPVGAQATPATTAAPSPAGGAAATTPAPVTTPPTDRGTPTRVTVQPGQSLWTVEQELTGAGVNWTDGWQVNQHRAEPAGEHFDDPNLLRPGWVLDIPTPARASAPAPGPPLLSAPATTPATAPPTTTPPRPSRPVSLPAVTLQQQPARTAPAALAPTSGRSAPSPAGAVPAAAPTTVAPSAAQAPPGPAQASEHSPAASQPTTTRDGRVVADRGEDPSSPVVAFAGAGLLLAGLCLAALRVNRRRQWRARRPGRLIGATPPRLQPTEAAMLSAGTTGYPDITWLDQALRGLVQALATDPEGRLPDVVAVRMTDPQLDLVLTTANSTRPPAPWAADTTGTLWTLTREQDPGYAEDRRGDFFAPYPTLVSLGRTTAGEHWLVDLERVGALSLAGDPTACLDLLRSLALELANSTWAEMLSVTLVGFGEELVPANPGRLAHAADVDHAILTAQRRHAAVAATSARLGVDVLTGRLHDVNADSWACHVLLVAPHIAAEPSALPALLAGMRTHGRRSAVAVVLADGRQHPEARWQLTLNAAGRVDVPDLGVRDLHAVAVPHHEGTSIAQLLGSSANTEDRPAPAATGGHPWDAWYADACGALRSEATTPGPALALTLARDPQDDAAEAVTGPSWETAGTGAAGEDLDNPTDLAPAADADMAPEPVAEVAAPAAQEATPTPDSHAEGDREDAVVPGLRPASPGSAAAETAAGATPAATPAATTSGISAVTLPTTGPVATSGGRAGTSTISDEVRAQVADNDPHLERDLHDWYDEDSPRPKVTLLGPTRVRAGGSLPADKPREEWHTEVVVYLSMHGRGVTGERAREDLWANDPGPRKLRDTMAKVRQWLGPDYLPDASSDGTYATTGLLVDGELFRRLRLRAIAASDHERVEYLRRALALVQGPPLTGRGQRETRGYRFLTAEPLDAILQSAIEDVAHQVATYHLTNADNADPSKALTAAEVAMRAGSVADTPLLDIMLALDTLGRTAEADAYQNRVLGNHADAEVEEDLPAATYEVLLSRSRRLSSVS